MRNAIIVSLFFLTGCAGISHKPAPTDWPRLEVREHRLSNWALLKQCYSSVSLPMKLLGGVAFACAWINLRSMTCDVYVHEDAGQDEPSYLHELEHCAGKDHYGDSTLADLWAGWKKHMTAGGATYVYVRHDGTTRAAR